MNYTKIKKEIEEEHQRMKEEMDNIQYLEAMQEIGIEVNK